MRIIYVLFSDDDGTFYSSPKPTGRTVATEEEAKEWVMKELWEGQRDYIPAQVD